jgi:hypothetical protein
MNSVRIVTLGLVLLLTGCAHGGGWSGDLSRATVASQGLSTAFSSPGPVWHPAPRTCWEGETVTLPPAEGTTALLWLWHCVPADCPTCRQPWPQDLVPVCRGDDGTVTWCPGETYGKSHP